MPTLEDRLNTFKELSKHCPVIWRYDPILLTDGIDVNWHVDKFRYLCENLQGHTNCCKISFVIESYHGCSKMVHAPSLKEKHFLMQQFSEIAKENNIQIQSCAENDDWSNYGITPSKCIDGDIFETLLSEKYKHLGIKVKRKNQKIDGQRKNCGCMPAVDIGRYDTCKHACNYCYAKKSAPQSMTDKPQGEIYQRKTVLEFVYE